MKPPSSQFKILKAIGNAIAIVLFFGAGLTQSHAQEIQCEVRIILEQLPSDARIRLQNFRQVVMDYFNNYRWTNLNDFSDSEDRIQMRLEFQFTAADIIAAPPRYSAQVAVSSSRPIYRSQRNTSILRFLDTDLDFIYDERQGNLIHNELIFNPLASFLDFYAYIVIGYDQDTFEKQGGTVHFERARRILQLAQSTNTFPRGWRLNDGAGVNRQNFVDELLDPRFFAAREALYDYHYNALDEFHADAIVARRKAADALKVLSETDQRFPRTMLIRRFFDSKFIEIGDVFRASEPALRREVYDAVVRADPSRRDKYEESLISGK